MLTGLSRSIPNTQAMQVAAQAMLQANVNDMRQTILEQTKDILPTLADGATKNLVYQVQNRMQEAQKEVKQGKQNATLLESESDGLAYISVFLTNLHAEHCVAQEAQAAGSTEDTVDQKQVGKNTLAKFERMGQELQGRKMEADCGGHLILLEVKEALAARASSKTGYSQQFLKEALTTDATVQAQHREQEQLKHDADTQGKRVANHNSDAQTKRMDEERARFANVA